MQAKNGGTIPEDQAPKAFLGATCVGGNGVDSQFVQNVFIPSGWKGERLHSPYD